MRFLGSEPCCHSAFSYGTLRSRVFYHTCGYGIETLVFKGLSHWPKQSLRGHPRLSSLSALNYPFSIIPRGEGENSTSDTLRRDYVLIIVTVLP